MRPFLSAALVAAVLSAGSARAGVWVEGAGGSGDAGGLPGNAQTILAGDLVGGGGLTAIEGRLGVTTFPGNVDMYRFIISTPTLFSATTVGTGGTLGDTQLFLFSAAGLGIAFNDDSTGLRSTLPVGNSLYASLAPGEYLLAISAFNTDPVSAGGLIFPNTFSGVHGPTGPGGGSPVTAWVNSGGTGTYRIELTGVSAITPAAVPAPPAVLLAGLGMLALAGVRRIRPRAA